MIAEDGDVVADLIHHSDRFDALGQRPDRRALYGVAGVDQQDVGVLLLHLLAQQLQPVIADIAVIIAVNIVGKEYRNGGIDRVRGLLCQGGEGEQYQGGEKRNQEGPCAV